MFEVNVNLTSICIPIGNICTILLTSKHVMYIPFKKNSPWNHDFTERKNTNAWILSIGRKEPTSVQQVIEAISGQQLTGKFNRVHVITDRKDKNIVG